MSANTNTWSTHRHQRTRSASAKMLTDFSIDSIIGHARPLVRASPAPAPPNSLALPPQPHSPLPLRAHERHAHCAANKKHRPKNFQCPACKMAFSNNGQLKNHVRIHTGERPFTCNHHDCNKSFTRNEELTRHKLIHTGVRPHICTTCGKRFGRKDHLKKHVRTHERKRQRKKVFVAKYDDVYSVPAKASGAPPMHHMQLTVPQLAHDTLCPVVTSCQSALSTRTTFTLPHQHQHQHQRPLLPATTIESQISAMLTHTPSATSASSHQSAAVTMQQIASDYWQKWYSLIGLYQQQQQPRQQPHYSPLDRLSSLFRRA